MSKLIKTAAALALCMSIAIYPAQAEPAVWTLSDEDTTISIVGTIHYLPEDADWRAGRIGEVFDAADTVCFELDAEARADESRVMMTRRGFFKFGDRLSEHLTNRQIRELKEKARTLRVPFTELDLMKPWLVSIVLDDIIIAETGYEDGVEFSLYPEILESGKTLCELETLEEQLGGWIDMELDDQIDALFTKYPGTEELSARESIEFGKDRLDALVEDWLEGDVVAIDEVVNTEASLSGPFHQALLVSRNTSWVPRIEAMLEQEGNIMIAVGAAHLSGDDSVIKMLRARGHKIKGP